jgi:hypothetical protein
MGDRGHKEILAASGVAESARRTGISEAFSNCTKAPAQRVLSVEAVMDVARTILQPTPCGEPLAEIEDVDAARTQEYTLLAMLLARTPDAATHVALAQAADNARAGENQIRSAIHGDRDAGIHAARASGRENHRRTRR